MDRKILIIHASVIVREGLSSIIHKFTIGENISMQVVPGVDAQQAETPDNLLVFSDVVGVEMLLRHTPDGFNARRKIVGVVDDCEKTADHAFFDEVISTGDPVTNIQRIVSRFFDIAVADNIRSEGLELTLREREVLKLVGTGFSNKEIADALFISTHTVISHRKNITEKLGIKSISGLTIYAVLNKIIDSEKLDIQTLI